ncbi:MAG: primosomal protein N' [bacterium]|nr:primosomal protein N' [bacterium]
MSIKILADISVKAYGANDYKTFTYSTNKELGLKVGSIVMIPFGKRQSLGVVIKIYPQDHPKPSYKILDVKEKIDINPLPLHLVKLAKWLADYYLASPKAIWQTILPSGLQVKNPRKLKQKTKQKVLIAPQIKLNPEQASAIKTIKASHDRAFLLHGITGSGKTEIYIRLIKEVINRSRSAIVLIPEISLTAQTVERFRSHFAGSIIVSHSKLTAAVRRNIWLEVLNAQKPQVIIGPRSSLFLPVQNLGLIVIDEEHESSYKQESAPKYNAVITAKKLADLTNSKLILGSATPSIASYFLTQKGKIKLLELKKRAKGQRLPEVEIIDLTKEPGLITDKLAKAIESTLKNRRQVILFLNRRGSANALICVDCGHTVKCPNCETTLTFHADQARLVCHYCGHTHLPQSICPQCQSTELIFIGSGTKKVEEQITKMFVGAKIARVDRDNSDIEHLDKVYQDLKNGEIDILIGTQMIARGLDIEGVDLVGVILADSMLAIPDFSSLERTFQLLTQVAGRAGRGREKAKVIIQTYAPDNPAVMHSKEHDFKNFYLTEIANRQKHSYPPFSYLLKLTYSNFNEARTKANAMQFADSLRKNYKNISVLGPVVCLHKKAANKFRYQVIVKSFDRTALAKIAKNLKIGWTADLDPINLV